ncbi:MAG: helix-turn-helix domain-containing protein [Sphingomonadales bacterium]
MGRKRTEIIDFKESVGLVIFLTRRKKNLSLAQLAALSGIPARQLDRYERGRSQFDLGALLQIARGLDVSFVTLLPGG